ncbi:hypothetical protein [Streptomyces abikoensis]|nr:hypothetical protein [Streptomyces abikoensis]GGP46819.1 hypothetical protein GCM10010214_19970 [Streptomyces abikoensis]
MNKTAELCRRGDRSVGQVAEDFDLIDTAARPFIEDGKRVSQVPSARVAC